jgi:hypothetical protein
LTSVTVAYLPKNSRPTVSSITVHLPGVIFQKPYAGDDGAVAGLDDAVKRPVPADTAPPMPLGKRMFQKGWQTIGWKADDADGDRLTYALAYRREGESAWHDLRAGLSDPIFVWDTATVPDGRYVIKVTASDSASNTADRALTGERESDAFDIDNTPPVITVTIARESRGIVAHVRVRDAQSPIDKVEYAIGGGAWTLVYPVDGLADSREEQYEIVVKSEADLNQMVIRATDLMQNVLSQPAVMRRRPSS